MITGRAGRMVCAATLLALTGCGPRAAGPSAERDQPAARTTQEPRAGADTGSSLPAAGRVAVRYVLAARSWTPDTYRVQHRWQVLLSTGSLRDELERVAPTRRQIAAYQEERAHVDASLIATTRLLQTPTGARYAIVLDERSVADGQTVRQRGRYLVELQRPKGAWRVAGFSVQP